jgi:hypothetical protein
MADGTPRLSDLREPPVVGRFYLVPVIRDYPYCGKVDTWPVLGPKHSDGEFIKFFHQHYHVDARFLTAAQERYILRTAPERYSTIEGCVGGWPLSNSGRDLPKGRPVLARRKCRRETYGYAFGHQDGIKALRAYYGERVEAVRLDDGRVLCPHRKADLTQFPPDADGMVMCPLHGLNVCVRGALDRTPA